MTAVPQSDAPRPPATDFDRWFAASIAGHDGVTCLIVLALRSPGSLVPLSSIYVHAEPGGLDWNGLTVMLAGAGHPWDAVAIKIETSAHAGPLDNPAAHRRLHELVARATDVPCSLWQCDVFDANGARIAPPGA